MTMHSDDRELVELVEGTIEPVRKDAVERHLARCERCRSAAVELRQLLSLEHDLARAGLHACVDHSHAVDGIMEALRAEDEERTRPASPLPSSAASPPAGKPRRPLLVTGVASTAIVALLAVFATFAHSGGMHPVTISSVNDLAVLSELAGDAKVDLVASIVVDGTEKRFLVAHGSAVMSINRADGDAEGGALVTLLASAEDARRILAASAVATLSIRPVQAGTALESIRELDLMR